MSHLTIRSAHAGTTLTVSRTGKEHLSVAVTSLTLCATHRAWVTTGDCQRLVAYFRDMAQHWTGWDGAKTWGTAAGDFKLSATTDNLGHVTLSLELADWDAPAQWAVQCQLELEAGQLETIANAMQSLFAGCWASPGVSRSPSFKATLLLRLKC